MEIELTVGQIIVIVQKSVPSLDALATQAVVKEHPLTRAATIEKVCVMCVCVCARACATVCVCVYVCVCVCVCVCSISINMLMYIMYHLPYRLRYSSGLHCVIKTVQIWSTTLMPSSITAWQWLMSAGTNFVT